ncbi:hypothetical protein Hte_002300 [Hypoxylon texense]
MHGILVDKKLPKVEGTLRNLLLDPLPRAETFLKANAGNHHSVVKGGDYTILKDNFTQLMIWELTGDADIPYLNLVKSEAKHGFWRIFGRCGYDFSSVPIPP